MSMSKFRYNGAGQLNIRWFHEFNEAISLRTKCSESMSFVRTGIRSLRSNAIADIQFV